MKFICIMGMSNSGKTSVENRLEQLGFKRSISYTTRKPQVRNGILEENGKEYIFVSREKFLKLVNESKIIEYEEYNGNLYGTPRPYGAKKHIAAVCLGGYKKLKEIYGNQVIGIYLKCEDNVALDRGMSRDGTTKLIKDRKNIDDKLLSEIENNCDIIINGNQDLNKVIADILKVFRDLEI